MKDNQIIHLGSQGEIDFVAIPETHPIWTADISDFSPVYGLLMKQALEDAVEAAQPLFHKPKGDMTDDTWMVMAVFAGVRKWFEEAYNRIPNLKQGAVLNSQHAKNMHRSDPHIVHPTKEIAPIPVELKITDDDVLAEYDFWVRSKNHIKEMLAQQELSRMQMMQAMQQSGGNAPNQRRGMAQMLGMPPNPSATSGTAEYGGAEKLPRSK